MGLIDYSDSETSESEKPVTTRAKAQAKSTFTKVVDRSNPHKILVQLPTPVEDASLDGTSKSEEPPAKKARTGAGAFGGFNAMLPAPKRTGQVSGSGLASTNKSSGGGAGPRVNLKTGAELAFRREAASPLPKGEDAPDGGDTCPDGSLDSLLETAPQQQAAPATVNAQPLGEIPVPDGQARKPLMFKPLSVSRKHTKKKTVPPPVSDMTKTAQAVPSSQPTTAPKVSLFSLRSSDELAPAVPSNGDYKPMIYDPQAQPDEPTSNTLEIQNSDPGYSELPQQPSHESSLPASQPQSLDAIAADLGLSESARRQLFGRQRGSGNDSNVSAVNVINFNTDQEYAANESLRAAGETVQHNPVRAIAPGKHSLKQLVNAASTQKDALEEHFATGKRNKKEAGSRYGW